MNAPTEGTLLGGRVRFAQPPKPAFRSGVEPVLLAASVPARAEERVVEVGCGAGAAMLCLCHRTGAGGIAVDADPAMCRIAARNVVANGAAVLVAQGDVAALPVAAMDHAFANPPYHGPGTASPHAGREFAKRGDAYRGGGGVNAWCAALLKAVRPGGTANVILPAGLLDVALCGFAAADRASFTVLPVWPRAGEAARFVILRAVRGGRSPTVLGAGLVLHETDGRFTAEAEAVLSGGGGWG